MVMAEHIAAKIELLNTRLLSCVGSIVCRSVQVRWMTPPAIFVAELARVWELSQRPQSLATSATATSLRVFCRKTFHNLARWRREFFRAVSLSVLLVVAGACVAADADADVPWDFSGPPRPFATSCFERFADEAADLKPEEAARWLARVEDRPLEITAPQSKYGGGILLNGLARLRAPWPPDAVLRLLLYNTTSVKLYFWTGEEGIRLQYYGDSRNRQVWVAYRITRPPAEQIVLDKRPHQVLDPELAMLTTDNRRNLRAATGVHEIRYQDGTLVLGQGDVRLLAVPVAGPPTDVYFEGVGTIIKRIAMHPGEPMPPEPQRQRRVVMRGDRPAELRWTVDLPPGARLEHCPDGAVRLLAQETAQTAFAAVPLVRPGLYEIIVAVDDPLPDTGLYLADVDGQLLDAVGFVRDARTGRTALASDLPDAAHRPSSLDIETAPTLFVSGRVWLRLVLAGGRLRCWSSGDGVHWGEILHPHPAAGAVEQIGLYSKATALPHGITLRQLRVRELDALASVAPLHLRQRAFEIGLPPSEVALADVGAWEQWVWENQPTDADPAAWRRACGLALMLSTQDVAVMNAVLDGLLREWLAGPAPLDRKLAVLEDAALVCQLYASGDCQRFAERFYDVGHQLLRNGDLAGFDSLRQALMRVPRFSYGGRIEALDHMLLRRTIECRATSCQWEDAAQLCRQLRFWVEQPIPSRRWPSSGAPLRRLVDWAEATAASRLPHHDREDGPLDADLGKAHQFASACEVITPPDSLIWTAIPGKSFKLPLVTTTIVVLLGVTAIVHVGALDGAASDRLLTMVCRTIQESSDLGYWLVVVIFAAILAAIMSTADSALLSLSSMLTGDVYRRLFAPSASQERLTRAGKALSWAVLAALVALSIPARDSTLVKIIDRKFDLLVQLAPAFFIGLHWPRLRAAAVLAGLIAGIAVAVALPAAGYPKLHGVHPGLYGLAINAGVAVIVSLARRPRRDS